MILDQLESATTERERAEAIHDARGLVEQLNRYEMNHAALELINRYAPEHSGATSRVLNYGIVNNGVHTRINIELVLE